jgi:hypothetical protein
MKEEKFSLPPKEEVHGFQVPEGYFEQLEEAVFDRIETISKPRPMWMQWVAIAASVVLLLGVGWSFLRSSSSLPSSALSQQEALDYIEDNLEEFEEELLISNWEDVDLTTTDASDS